MPILTQQVLPPPQAVIRPTERQRFSAEGLFLDRELFLALKTLSNSDLATDFLATFSTPDTGRFESLAQSENVTEVDLEDEFVPIPPKRSFTVKAQIVGRERGQPVFYEEEIPEADPSEIPPIPPKRSFTIRAKLIKRGRGIPIYYGEQE